MHEITDRLLAAMEEGRLSRREVVTRLVALATAFAGGARSGVAGATDAPASGNPPTFQSVGLNHIALRVSDLDRSRAFYQRHLGLKLLAESSHNCFLGAGGNNFVALFRGEAAGLDHYCYTIDGYHAGTVVDRLRAAGLEPRRQEDRVYFDDPDGLEVQIAGAWNDYPGERP